MAGKYYEDLESGDRFDHELSRTITETDNILFCGLTMNTQPLHVSREFVVKNTEFKDRIVNGLLTLATAVGISVPDLTQGTVIANLGYDHVRHGFPVYPGDTLFVETEVIDKRDSKSRPEAGIVRFRHTGKNQDGKVVVSFERTVLMFKRGKVAGSGRSIIENQSTRRGK